MCEVKIKEAERELLGSVKSSSKSMTTSNTPAEKKQNFIIRTPIRVVIDAKRRGEC